MQHSDPNESLEGIDWLIIGAQTQPYRPPRIEWVQEIVEAADRAGVPVWLKDNLDPILNPNGHIWAFSPNSRGAYSLKQEWPR